MSAENDLPAQLQQVESMKKTLENDITQLTDHFEQLKIAQGKFMDASVTLSGLSAITQDREVMVPMTSSLYVPGKLVGGSQVLVDIGTNFIVGKSAKEADQIFQKKIVFLKSNTESLLKIINDKKGDLGKLDGISEQIQRALGAAQQPSS